VTFIPSFRLKILKDPQSGRWEAPHKYKKGWSKEQIEAADAKVAAINAADQLVYTNAEEARGNISAADLWRTAGLTIPAGSDIDHIVDVQLGGSPNDINNLSPLDESVNCSLGPQIYRQVKRYVEGLGLNYGDVLNINFSIIPRQLSLR
jgi:hypothetical protein